MGRIKHLHLINPSDTEVTLERGPALGWSMATDVVPRTQAKSWVNRDGTTSGRL